MTKAQNSRYLKAAAMFKGQSMVQLKHARNAYKRRIADGNLTIAHRAIMYARYTYLCSVTLR